MAGVNPLSPVSNPWLVLQTFFMVGITETARVTT